MATDYYTVLEVSPAATTRQIRAKFLELARRRHPDLFQGAEKDKAEAEFQSITEAFNVLSNPDRRRQHDVELATPSVQNQVADPRQMVRVFMQRGAKAYKEGGFLEAAENFDRATKLDDANASAWYNLALSCSHEPKWASRAMSAISKACDLEKRNGSYFKLAGRLFLDGGMPLRAERYYRQASKWLGEDQEVLSAMAKLEKRK